MVRLLIVSEIRLYREGLARVLAADGRVDVVHTAASVEDAISARLTHRPDVVVLDRAGPAALSSVGTILAAWSNVKVVALGVANAESDVIGCAEAGVAGYVMREGSVEDLVATVESAAQGEFRCSPKTAATLLRRVASLAATREDPSDPVDLTPRQRDILQLVNEGLSNKEIATRLCIQVATVKNHIHTILEKLGVHRRGEAAAKLRRVRILRLNPR